MAGIPRCVGGPSVGLKYDIMFPVGERRTSLRAGQNAFAPCCYSGHPFLIPPCQGASSIHHSVSSAQSLPFTSDE